MSYVHVTGHTTFVSLRFSQTGVLWTYYLCAANHYIHTHTHTYTVTRDTMRDVGLTNCRNGLLSRSRLILEELGVV